MHELILLTLLELSCLDSRRLWWAGKRADSSSLLQRSREGEISWTTVYTPSLAL